MGYPGETEEDFSQLLDLVRQGIFDHVGAFTYSSEPGTPAARLTDDIPSHVKESRKDQLMRAQQDIRKRRLRDFRGRILEVMVDEAVVSLQKADCPPDTRYVGRTRMDAPEVDGVVFITPPLQGKKPKPGDRLQVKITDSTAYDLIGHPA